MKAVIYRLMVFLFLAFLLTLPSATAQGDSDDETGDAESCIFGTFCLIMLFIMFLLYLSAKRKSEVSRQERLSGQPRTPPYRWGGHPPRMPPRTYPSPMSRPHHLEPEPQKKDVKCDLCGSKNLRFFEEGYVKCNDCRHVFYITEGYRTRGR